MVVYTTKARFTEPYGRKTSFLKDWCKRKNTAFLQNAYWYKTKAGIVQLAPGLICLLAN